MSDELSRPSSHFKRYTAFGAAVDLVGADSIKTGWPCRRMRFETAGTATVKRAGDLTPITLNVKDGESFDIACTSIDSVTGVTAITVFW